MIMGMPGLVRMRGPGAVMPGHTSNPTIVPGNTYWLFLSSGWLCMPMGMRLQTNLTMMVHPHVKVWAEWNQG
jgi:hypothetical protein